MTPYAITKDETGRQALVYSAPEGGSPKEVRQLAMLVDKHSMRVIAHGEAANVEAFYSALGLQMSANAMGAAKHEGLQLFNGGVSAQEANAAISSRVGLIAFLRARELAAQREWQKWGAKLLR